MKRLLEFLFLLTGLASCNSSGILQSDIDKLIEQHVEANKKILQQMQTFTRNHGKEGFEFQNTIVTDFSRTHSNVMSLIDSLKNFNGYDRVRIVRSFMDNAFRNYDVQIPFDLVLTEETPLSLIKLQIVETENIYLREWQGHVGHRFNNIAAIIVPDKIQFNRNEKITGTVGWMAYADDMKLKIKVNGQDIDVINGKGYFSIEPEALEGKQTVKAEIIFPDTVYSTQMRIE